tara:strand:+ start:466 stop:774 length:309 start_codon:yes stop_codon:yes gene_type:complete
VPIYLQIIDQIKYHIATGALAADDEHMYLYAGSQRVWVNEIQESGLTERVEEFAFRNREEFGEPGMLSDPSDFTSRLKVDGDHIYFLTNKHLFIYPGVKKAG